MKSLEQAKLYRQKVIQCLPTAWGIFWEGGCAKDYKVSF